jgi:CDP-glucose 4,6-dehydratase
MGTVNVLDAVRRHGESVRAVVNVTSDKCYENREWEWGYREHEAMGGHDPYSSSKGCAELVASAFGRSFFTDPDGTRLASARAGNVIGGGDWAQDRLVADVMQAALAGEQAGIRNPNSIRPWQHVLSPLSGYLRVAEGLIAGEPVAEAWNFGPDPADERPVRWLVERWPLPLDVRAGTPEPREAATLRVDSSKALARLSWEPVWDLATGLAAAADWYAAVAAGADARTVTLQQIEDFERQRT